MKKSTFNLSHATMIEGKLLHKGTKVTIFEDIDDNTDGFETSNSDYEGSADGNYSSDTAETYPNQLRRTKKSEDEIDEDDEETEEDCGKKSLKRAGDEIDMSLFPM